MEVNIKTTLPRAQEVILYTTILQWLGTEITQQEFVFFANFHGSSREALILLEILLLGNPGMKGMVKSWVKISTFCPLKDELRTCNGACEP